MTHRLEGRTAACGLLLLIALGGGAVHAQRQPTASAAERALFDVENAWARAVVRRDAAGIRRLVAPRWVYSDESGTMSREEGIRAFTTGADSVHEAGNDSMRAIVYGGTAVVTGVLWMRGRGPKGPFVHRYRYTDTWMRLDGRWQCIASQDYLLPEQGT